MEHKNRAVALVLHLLACSRNKEVPLANRLNLLMNLKTLN